MLLAGERGDQDVTDVLIKDRLVVVYGEDLDDLAARLPDAVQISDLSRLRGERGEVLDIGNDGFDFGLRDCVGHLLLSLFLMLDCINVINI